MFLISFHSVGRFCPVATADRAVTGAASRIHAARFSGAGLKELGLEDVPATNSHVTSIMKFHIVPLCVAEGFLLFFSPFFFPQRAINQTSSFRSVLIQTPRQCNYCTALKDSSIYIIDSFIEERLAISLIRNLLCRMDFLTEADLKC